VSCKRDNSNDKETFPVKFDAFLRNSSPQINQFSANCTIKYNDSLAKGEDDTAAYEVRINGLLTTRHDINGHFVYEGNSPSMMHKEYKLTATNEHDKNLYFSFDNPIIDSLWINPSSGGQGISIHWTGADLKEDEKITWILTGGGQTNMGTVSGPVSTHDIQISPDQSKLIPPGKALLSLVRTYNYKSLDENNEINVRAEYTTYQIQLQNK
jgi:hypothetical protein